MKSVGLVRAIAVGATLSGWLAGCGGSGGENVHAFLQPISGGIWHGTDSLSGQPLHGIVAEDGTFAFIRDDNQAFYIGAGTFDTQVPTFMTAGFEAFTAPGITFDDGAVHGTGLVQGRVSTRNTMKLDVQFLTDLQDPTDPAEVQTGTIRLEYDEAYERDSSLPRIAGLYAVDTDTLSIDSTGVVFAQLTASGCVINGAVTIKDAKYNVYGMSLTYASCTGGNSVLNGLTFTGVVTIDSSQFPERVVGGLGSTNAGIMLTLPRK